MNSPKEVRLEPVLSPRQQQTYTDLHNALNLHQPQNWDEISRWDSALPDGAYFERWLAYAGEDLLGGASMMNSHWTGRPDEFAIGIRPALGDGAQDRSFRLIRHLESLGQKQGWRLARCHVPGNQAEVTAAFHQAGYQVVQENPETELDLTAFSAEPWAEKVRQVEQEGITLDVISDLEKTVPDFMRRFWAMQEEIFQDVPIPGGLQPRSLKDFEKEMKVWRRYFGTSVVARAGDEWIGTSELFHNTVNPKRFSTGLTGVCRAWRRRGVATAMKVVNLQRAKEAGGEAVTTDNEKDNPMLELNKRLGFREIYVLRFFERIVGR